MSWLNAEQGWRKGPWTIEEDKLLSQYVTLHGEGRWSSVSRCAGLNRSGKSCRLRWVNYLKPGLKRGQITPQEEGIIIELHALWGNKWSTIARYLPGRTDNEIKNYWRTHFKKKERSTRKSSERRKSLNVEIKPQVQLQHEEIHQIKQVVLPTPQGETNSNNMDYANTKQEQMFMDSSTSMDDNNPIISTPVLTSNWMDDSLYWGGLWNNFGDQIAPQQEDQLCGKMALSFQNQATNTTNNSNNIINNNGLFWEDNSNNIYNDQGFSFQRKSSEFMSPGGILDAVSLF